MQRTPMIGANLSSAFTNTCSPLTPIVHAIQYWFIGMKKKIQLLSKFVFGLYLCFRRNIYLHLCFPYSVF